MDFYEDTPADRFFADDSFELRKSDHQGVKSNGANLWLSFSLQNNAIDLTVYDEEVHADTHKFTGVFVEDVEPFIQAIEKDYGVTIPGYFRNLTEWFLKAQGGSFTLEVFLGDPNDPDRFTSCETCGDYNSNSVTAYYIPEFRNIPASLAVGWSYGCYGGDKAAGEDTSRNRDAAVQLLQKASAAAQTNEARDDIQGFITKLNSTPVRAEL